MLRWVERCVGPGSRATPGRRLTGGIAAAVSTVDVVTAGGGRLSLVVKQPMPDPTEPDQVGREARALAIARGGGLPVPEVIGTDPDGAETGETRLLMTRLPGRHRIRMADWRQFVRTLIEVMTRIHAVDVSSENLPPYEPYDSALAPEILRLPEPAGGPRVFIHRDFHQANVLWFGGRVSGVVDWVHACTGSAWADVAHLRWNLHNLVSPEAADFVIEEFQRLNPQLPPYHPHWDVATVASMSGQKRDRFLAAAVSKL